MGKIHGKDSFLALEDSGAVFRTLSTWCDNIEMDMSVDMADSTTIGVESKEFLPGLDGASITLSGKWDSVVTVGPDVVLSGLKSAKLLTGFRYGPGGGTVGLVSYEGDCYVERYAVSSPLEGVVKFNATLRVSGGVTRGAFA